MPTFRVVVENKSRYAIDCVWENAQDLEHVQYLHPNTNRVFQLMHVDKHPGSKYQYNTMVYRGTRKVFGIFTISAMGFRTIVSDYNIHQIEHIPMLGVTSALNSLLYETGDPEFPTLMRDEVVMEVPRLLYFFRGYLGRALQRHARIQCAEDEPFRERRTLLAKKGIKLPYTIFFKSAYEQLTGLFQEVPFKKGADGDLRVSHRVHSQKPELGSNPS